MSALILGLGACGADTDRPSPGAARGDKPPLIDPPPGSEPHGRPRVGTERSTSVYDVPSLTARDTLDHLRPRLQRAGWRERTRHSPTGTSAAGGRRADFVRAGWYLQLQAVPIPAAYVEATGFTTRLTVVLSRDAT